MVASHSPARTQHRGGLDHRLALWPSGPLGWRSPHRTFQECSHLRGTPRKTRSALLTQHNPGEAWGSHPPASLSHTCHRQGRATLSSSIDGPKHFHSGTHSLLKFWVWTIYTIHVYTVKEP